jgi:hypothetical protein
MKVQNSEKYNRNEYLSISIQRAKVINSLVSEGYFGKQLLNSFKIESSPYNPAVPVFKKKKESVYAQKIFDIYIQSHFSLEDFEVELTYKSIKRRIEKLLGIPLCNEILFTN